ncbi:MAG: hypothetical protein FRX48_04425 [Lasallia pustulata]|uniref:Uncharacterized protein n=1 Tax=Lasallia pustulata TaxID=136370 RepID=A0A5M8PRW0_9LECA|nr:MAG: hypothetical protein FRX48_04425 [Lasallia pustulata]
MLLPSALPCDVVRPTHSHTHLRFSSTSAPPSPLTTGIYTTCLALQLLLSAPTSSPTPRSPPPPNPQTHPPKPHRPSPQSAHNAARALAGQRSPAPAPASQTAPRLHPPSSPSPETRRAPRDPTTPDRYSTPKRRRLLPLGLAASGSAAPCPQPPRASRPPAELSPPPAELVRSTVPHTPPTAAAPASASASGLRSAASADHRLVSLILSTLDLSRREWDGCARRLGRGRDGMGRGRGKGRERGRGENVWK